MAEREHLLLELKQLDLAQLELVRPKINWEVRFRLASYLIEFGYQKLGGQRNQWRHAPEWETADTLPLFRQLVLALARRVKTADAELLVMLIHPRDGENRGPSARNTRVLSIFAENGIATLDTYEAFSPDGIPKIEFYQSDGHWNAAGNRLAAELLSAELRRRGWL